MPVNKLTVNNSISAISENPTFNNQVTDAATTAVEDTYAQAATLFGKAEGEIVGGVQGLEQTLENTAATSLGDTLTNLTGSMSGASGTEDPSQQTLSISLPGISSALESLDSDGNGGWASFDPDGGSEPQAMSAVIAQITGLGPVPAPPFVAPAASGLDALVATMEKVDAKVNEAKDAITAGINDAIGGATAAMNELTDQLQTFTSGATEALAGSVSSIPSLNPNANPIEQVSDFTGNSSITGAAQGAINEVAGTAKSVVTQITEGTNLTSAFANKTAGLSSFQTDQSVQTGQGILQDILESQTRTGTTEINNLLVGAEVTDAQSSDLLQRLATGEQGEIGKVVQEVSLQSNEHSPEMRGVIQSIDPSTIQSTDQFINEVRTRANFQSIPQDEVDFTASRLQATERNLSQIDTTISGNLVVSAIQYYDEDTSIQDNQAKFNGANTEDFSAFSYISSMEELALEIKLITRDITEIILHASETYTNQNIGVEELHLLHNESGFDGIQYHYVIRRDGRIQRGRPSGQVSEASAINGHSNVSIDVCLVGGLNCPTGTDNPEDYRSIQSYTRTQMTSLEQFCRAFFRYYPGGQVLGHNDIQSGIEDPYFDVRDYVENVFRRYSLYQDPISEAALKPKELLEKSL